MTGGYAGLRYQLGLLLAAFFRRRRATSETLPESAGGDTGRKWIVRGGIALPFVREKMKNGRETRIIAVEPTAAPSLTKGVYAFDYGDTARMAPIVKMHTLGHDFVPSPIHAGKNGMGTLTRWANRA